MQAGVSAPAAAPSAAGALVRPRRLISRRTLREQPRLAVALVLVVALMLLALVGPLLTPYDPIKTSPGDQLQPPSLAHPLGTDDLGRDVLARTLYGARISLPVGVLAVLIGLTCGMLLGLPAGYIGGWYDLLAMRFVDALLAFPGLILAISITSALGPQIQNAMIAIGIVTIPVYARLSRGQVLQARSREYVEAARTIGAGDTRIVVRHILPNIVNPLIVQATLSIAFAILAEAGLSFLGLGAQPPTPTWGFDINHARGYLTNAAWMSIGPGLAILLSVFTFNLLGDSLRDLLDPTLRVVVGRS